VFVYVTAVYPSHKPDAPPSRAIIWDAILPSTLEPWHQNQYIHPTTPPKQPGRKRQLPKGRIYSEELEPGKLRMKGQKPKYVITDYTGSIANRTGVVLELGWNVQPWVGALMWSRKSDLGVWKATKGGLSEEFDFPPLKAAAKPAAMDTVRGAEGNRG
jgi:signal peptidase complex subunit 3